MGSITGLKRGIFTSIDNSGQFRVGSDINPGTAGQALVSGGPDLPSRWDTHTGIIQPLTMGTNLSLASGNATFNGGTADTINAVVAPALTGGNGIDITGTSVSTDNDNITIANSSVAFPGKNQVLKVPNALTAGTDIGFSVGTTYDGSSAITINSQATDTTYQGSTTINIDTSTNPDTINCLKVPNSLTINSVAFDGSVARNFTLATSNTEYTAGANLALTSLEFSLKDSIADMNDIAYESGFYDSTLVGNDYPSKPTVATYLDLSSSTNIQGLPPDVFDVSGAFRMTINLANFMSNDDSTFYNIIAEDDLSGKIHGSIKPANAVVEMVGYFIVPNGFTATAARVDITNSGGGPVSRTLTFEQFTTYGATGFTPLGTGTSNSEQTFSASMAAASDRLLMIRINTTSTADHVRGGYILLTR